MVFSKFTQNYSASSSRIEAKKGDDPAIKCPIELSIKIESPPCVMYGSAADSPGVLLAGLLTLKVKGPNSKRNFKKKATSRSDSADSLETTRSESSSKRKTGLGFSSPFSTLSMLNNNTPPSPKGSSSSSNSNSNSNHETGSTYRELTVSSVSLRLLQKIHYHRPFVPDSSTIHSCTDCKTKVTELKLWEIQKDSMDKSIGEHSYPFSDIILGSLPSTSSLGANAMTNIEYELVAITKYSQPQSGAAKSLKLNMPIQITRSILRGPDKNSLRVFPPTELTAAAVLPNVIHPKSSFPLEMKLDGVSSGDRRWRMRKLSWRIEETTRVRSNACKNHAGELKQLEKEVKQKEIERSKKPIHPIKRYGDIGPQVRVAVSSPENMPIGRMRTVSGGLNDVLNNISPFTEGPIDPSVASAARRPSQPNVAQPSHLNTETPAVSRPNRNHDIDDDDENGENGPFIHPSDDALRQEIFQQQQRQRDEIVKQEFKNNNSTLFTEEVRIVAKGEMKSGWKTDFDNHGKIELVTEIDCMSLTTGVRNSLLYSSTAKPIPPQTKPNINLACDIQDLELGIYINHILAVEIVVAEETLQYANGQPISKHSNDNSTSSSAVEKDDQRLAEISPMFATRSVRKGRPVEESESSKPTISNNGSSSKKTNESGLSAKIVSVPTGAARVLRMQFRLNVTERSGLGVSWDEEVPPIYQDVKQTQSPPSYDHTINMITSSNLNSVLSNSSIDDPNREGDVEVLTRTYPPSITPPAVAHHHSNGSGSTSNDQIGSTLNRVTSPALENVMSIQGNVPMRGQLLTPANTRNVGIRNISHILDSDRITQ